MQVTSQNKPPFTFQVKGEDKANTPTGKLKVDRSFLIWVPPGKKMGYGVRWENVEALFTGAGYTRKHKG